jgi:hypothetical protein
LGFKRDMTTIIDYTKARFHFMSYGEKIMKEGFGERWDM